MGVGLAVLEGRARSAYEQARLRRAALGAAPILALAALATFAASRPAVTALLGAALVVSSLASLWFGRRLPRALLAGVLAGALPLASLLCIARFGHECFGAACQAVCLTAAGAGGVAAGLLVGEWSGRVQATPALTGAASAFGLVTGAMGGCCLGLTAIVALAAGMAAAIAVQRLRGDERGTGGGAR